MTKKEKYLVPIDFSRGADKAFVHALKMTRERHAKLYALHVVPAELIYPPMGGRFASTICWSAMRAPISPN